MSISVLLADVWLRIRTRFEVLLLSMLFDLISTWRMQWLLMPVCWKGTLSVFSVSLSLQPATSALMMGLDSLLCLVWLWVSRNNRLLLLSMRLAVLISSMWLLLLLKVILILVFLVSMWVVSVLGRTEL